MILYLSHISLAWSHEIRQFEKSRYFDLLNEGRNHSNALCIDAIQQKSWINSLIQLLHVFDDVLLPK